MPRPSIERFIKRVILFLPARRFRKNTSRAIAEIEAILPSIENQWRKARELGLSKYSPLYNSMSFLLLLHYDFAVLAFNHATEIDERKQNLYARQLCLLVHEALEDIPNVFGGSFHESAKSLPNGDKFLAQITSAQKLLSNLRKTNQAPIAEVRHFVAAHRDHDALKQLEVMRKIDTFWLISISNQFIEFLSHMESSLTPLLSEMGNPTVIFQHVTGRS